MSSTSPQQPSEDAHAADSEKDIDAFLREEGVPDASQLTQRDIFGAIATLGYTVAATSVKFLVKMSLRRLDTLACVEGELQRDAAGRGEATEHRRPRMSALQWSRHLYGEDKSALTFLRGGWAELGFVLATTVEESAMILALRAVFKRLNAFSAGSPRSGLSWMCLNVFCPMVVAGLLSWPLRAVRTAVMVNYLVDTTLPASAPAAKGAKPEGAITASAAETQEAATTPASGHRYRSAVDVWGRVRRCMGVRSLLSNGLDVDLGGRVLSMALVWTVVQPVTRWFREVAAVRARAAAESPVPSAMPTNASPLLMRLGQHRLFNLAALAVVVGAVNTLQRPFVVLRQRMALLPAEETGEAASARRGCRYVSGWDCACQVVRREGVTALFAGLPLCLLTSTVVPLVVTFAGLPIAPSFSGAAV